VSANLKSVFSLLPSVEHVCSFSLVAKVYVFVSAKYFFVTFKTTSYGCNGNTWVLVNAVVFVLRPASAPLDDCFAATIWSHSCTVRRERGCVCCVYLIQHLLQEMHKAQNAGEPSLPFASWVGGILSAVKHGQNCRVARDFVIPTY